jgi:hypothetical protein
MDRNENVESASGRRRVEVEVSEQGDLEEYMADGGLSGGRSYFFEYGDQSGAGQYCAYDQGEFRFSFGL